MKRDKPAYFFWFTKLIVATGIQTKCICLLLFVLLFSCVDEKDYKLSSVDINPSVTIPLTYGSVSIKDFLSDKDSAYIKTDKDGLLSLVYSQNLLSQDIRDKFKIPNTTSTSSIVLAAVNLPQVPQDAVLNNLSTLVDLNLTPEQLSEISFKSGQLTVSTSLTPNSNVNYEMTVSLPDFTSKTTNLPLTLTGKGTLPTIQLSNYIVKLNKNKFTANISFVLKKTSGQVNIVAGTKANVQLSLTGMDFSYIKGFFGEQSVAIPSSSIDIGAYGNSLNKATLSLAQPTIGLIVSNDYGVPVTVDYKTFEARKSNASPITLTLNPANPVLINAPTVLGSSAITNIAITNTNQIINYAPTQLYYQATATVNKGVTSGANFLADTSKVRVKLNVNIPLYGKASGILLGDTVAIDLSSVNQSQISEATLKIKITNEMPLDGSVQFYLTDSNYVIQDQLLDTSQTSFIKGSTVTASGDLQKATLSEQTIPILKEKVNKIFTAKYIIIAAIMSTSKDASGNAIDVKFRSQYKMTVETGIAAKLNFNIKL